MRMDDQANFECCLNPICHAIELLPPISSRYLYRRTQRLTGYSRPRIPHTLRMTITASARMRANVLITKSSLFACVRPAKAARNTTSYSFKHKSPVCFVWKNSIPAARRPSSRHKVRDCSMALGSQSIFMIFGRAKMLDLSCFSMHRDVRGSGPDPMNAIWLMCGVTVLIAFSSIEVSIS